MSHFRLVLFCSLTCTSLLTPRVRGEDSSNSFSRSVAPILAEKCLQCHGPDEANREADLRLDMATDDDVQRAALEHSLLERINTTDPDLRMPPPSFGKVLEAAERRQLQAWIESGAKFEGHWAYQPIAPPPGDGKSTPTIDSLIAKGWKAKGLVPAPKITKSQWLRRAYIDLIGIPPTWEELDAFENDASSSADQTVIDRLLDSTAYGQRWGKYWLDLARYADTHGGAAIGFTSFPFSYTYRDYVIQAFNDDRPYNQFILEQIAADQLGLEPTDPKLAGLGFLTVGMQFRNMHDTLDDQIDVVTRGLMGVTVTCARCHDHKFDAIPTRDYYAIYAALAPSSVPAELPIIDAAPVDGVTQEQRAAYLTQLETLKTQDEEMARDQIEIMKQRLRMQTGMYLRELASGLPEQDVATAFLSYRTDDLRPVVYNRWKSYIAGLSQEDAVFGIWHQLSALPAEGFSEAAAQRLATLEAQNPDAAKIAELHALAAIAPKWNPLVIESLKSKQNMQSMRDVADAYGELFTRVHQEWLQALHSTALEALSSQSVVPDEDAQHKAVNSPIYRQLRRHLYGAGTPTDLSDGVARQVLNRTIADSLAGKRGAIHGHHLNSPGSVPRAMALEEPETAQESFVFLRGNHMTLGEKVHPGFLSAISNGTAEFSFRPGMRRLALAQAIVSPDNPLTRRVIVNWVWQQHFGQGLVRSADDFGTRGTPPSNPELLDLLATQFLEAGWSIKALHRNIMLSDAYRLASVELEASRRIDPENEQLWRMPRRRLDFEAMRDSMLSVSGELDPSLGGRPIDFSTSPASIRRTVYGFVNRDIVSNLASTFDSANPNACTLKRPDTLVPQQTLFALNSDFIQQRARRLAELALATQLDDNRARVQWLYRRIHSRAPSAEEIEMACQFLDAGERVREAASDASQPDTSPKETLRSATRRWESLAHAMLASNEFSFVD